MNICTSSKTKILFITSKMIVGGVEKALIGLLGAIDQSKYEVTLLLTKPGGSMECLIPKGIDVEYLNVDIASYDQKLLNKKNYLLWGNNKIKRCAAHFIHNYCANTRLVVGTWPNSDKEYDVVVAFKADDVLVSCLADRFPKAKKILWIHAEFEDSGFYLPCYRGIISRFDHVVCVSTMLRQIIEAQFPKLRGSVHVIYNLLNLREIRQSATEPVNGYKNESCIRLVTVGRLSEEKGQRMIPETARMLVDAGYSIRWYLVGDGATRKIIEEACKRLKVEENVILLGTQNNPYPYIKNCDIYVQPSFTEGYCTTTMEAKILCKPIVTTDAPGMREQFVSGENGLIVNAMTPEALAQGIKTLLDHPEIMEKFRNALKKESYDTTKELQKLYDLIES